MDVRLRRANHLAMHILNYHIGHNGWIIFYSRYYWIELSGNACLALSMLSIPQLALIFYAARKCKH